MIFSSTLIVFKANPFWLASQPPQSTNCISLASVASFPADLTACGSHHASQQPFSLSFSIPAALPYLELYLSTSSRGSCHLPAIQSHGQREPVFSKLILIDLEI